jgi:hypothetical protein
MTTDTYAFRKEGISAPMPASLPTGSTSSSYGVPAVWCENSDGTAILGDDVLANYTSDTGLSLGVSFCWIGSGDTPNE